MKHLRSNFDKDFGNFDKKMQHDFDDFDKKFDSMKRTAITGWIITACISLGIIGFLGWVIVMVMKHFGIF